MILNELNKKEALRYMGCGVGKPDERTYGLLLKCERELLKAINPKLVYRLFDIESGENGIDVLGTSLRLGGKSITEHLEGCQSCILMAVTLSDSVDKLIMTLESTDMTRAVMTDCLASAAVEQVCELAEEEIRQRITDKFFTWRFSPGYGDLPLDCQGDFLNVLNAQKRIGLNVTDSLIMIPRKSVTAVIGVSDTEIPQKRRGCAGCMMNDRCLYRKRGEHCGL